MEEKSKKIYDENEFKFNDKRVMLIKYSKKIKSLRHYPRQ